MLSVGCSQIFGTEFGPIDDVFSSFFTGRSPNSINLACVRDNSVFNSV